MSKSVLKCFLLLDDLCGEVSVEVSLLIRMQLRITFTKRYNDRKKHTTTPDATATAPLVQVSGVADSTPRARGSSKYLRDLDLLL